MKFHLQTDMWIVESTFKVCNCVTISTIQKKFDDVESYKAQ